jgi:hypothetical protein
LIEIKIKAQKNKKNQKKFFPILFILMRKKKEPGAGVHGSFFVSGLLWWGCFAGSGDKLFV